MGQMNNKPVSIMLDSGSTHNFIDPRVVHRTGFSVAKEPTFSATIASGDKLYCVNLYMLSARMQTLQQISTYFQLEAAKWCWE